MTRDELLKSPEYWTSEIQMELYRQIQEFMDKKHLNRTQLAGHLGCTKGYVTQLLNGDFDHKISKLVELSLAIGKVPEISYHAVDEYVAASDTYSTNVVNNAYYSSSSFDTNYLKVA